MFKNLGIIVSEHAGKILAGVTIALIAMSMYGIGVFSSLSGSSEGFGSKDSESQQAQNEINKQFGKNDASYIVLLTPKRDVTVADPQYRQAVEKLTHTVSQDGAVVSTYYNTGSEQFVSHDKKSTFIAVTLPGSMANQERAFERVKPQLKSELFSIKIGGPIAMNKEINMQVQKDLVTAEAVSFPLLALLLILVFRSLVAALLPLVLGAFAILCGFIFTRLLTEVIDISHYAINVITLLGLGLAVDYSLFIVSRFREEMRRRQSVSAALIRTVETAGRTIFFSGLTIIISLLGMLVFPLDLLHSIAWGGSAAVLAAMIGALVVLPAILQQLGHRVNYASFGSARRDLKAYQRGEAAEREKESIWLKIGRISMRHPRVAFTLTVLPLVLASIPLLHTHFSSPDYRSLPVGSESRTVAETLINDFGNQSSPVRVVYRASSDIMSSEQLSKLYDFVQQIKQLPQVEGVDSVVTALGNLPKEQFIALLTSTPQDPRLQSLRERFTQGNVALLDVRYDGSSDSENAVNLVKDIRKLPPPQGVQILVGGESAALYDLLDTIRTYTPYGLAIVVVTLLVLLFLMLGSVILPLKAIVLNIISLGAAFGILVWIFQDGHVASFFNLTASGSIDATNPILIFAIAFGLSMDYSVFLYSRIKERYEENGHDSDEAVMTGLQKTGPIISSAAILLFVVVASFATGRIPLIQQIGVGLALTVLIDAFVIRMLLVPVTMKLLGHWNWWAPKPLRKFQERFGLKH
ncbi:MAG: hypothetical protein JWL85_59 [Candidatus Saccharibacteria bacterium]|nr:hypothetical protein [Candidatus Saccharibacteria bacterium]